jgi:hypothetical protein
VARLAALRRRDLCPSIVSALCVGYNHGMSEPREGKPYRFTRGSRRHRIGRASARHVIEHVEPVSSPSDLTNETVYTWIGRDERGRELEIVGIERPDCVLIVHVMPSHYREGVE